MTGRLFGTRRGALGGSTDVRRFRQTVLQLAGVCIVVTCGGDTGPTAPVMVLTTITVLLSATTVHVGQAATAIAAGVDQNGGVIATGAVSWTSSSPTVATVSANGALNAVAAGQTTITAAAGNASGKATLTVIPVPVASVTALPASATIVVGATQQLTATTFDASNAELARRIVTWSSSDTTRATVSSAGRVTALALGTATITATSEGKAATAAITEVSSLLGDFGFELFGLVPSGSFQMGSTVGVSSEGPIHAVTISRAFYRQKTEVTQAPWRTVMATSPSNWSSCGDACPVENVSWNDIQNFLQALVCPG